jgi:hypothetical protein
MFDGDLVAIKALYLKEKSKRMTPERRKFWKKFWKIQRAKRKQVLGQTIGLRKRNVSEAALDRTGYCQLVFDLELDYDVTTILERNHVSIGRNIYQSDIYRALQFSICSKRTEGTDFKIAHVIAKDRSVRSRELLFDLTAALEEIRTHNGFEKKYPQVRIVFEKAFERITVQEAKVGTYNGTYKTKIQEVLQALYSTYRKFNGPSSPSIPIELIKKNKWIGTKLNKAKSTADVLKIARKLYSIFEADQKEWQISDDVNPVARTLQTMQDKCIAILRATEIGASTQSKSKCNGCH